MSDATRVVFDCNALLQAMASPGGPSGRCVQLALEGAVTLIVSFGVLGELRDVANRPQVSAKLRLTPARVQQFCEAIEVNATVVDDVPSVFHYERDEDDAHYVNLALAGGASVIVSRDRDLLDLMDTSRGHGRDFRVRFPWLRIVTPVQLLRELSSMP